MKAIVAAVFFAGCIEVVGTGCAGSAAATPSMVSTTGATVPMTPGATLSVRLERTDSPSRLNTAVFLSANHLMPPYQVAPGATLYKVWIASPGQAPQSLGSVVPDPNGHAALDTVAPSDEFEISITPESGKDVAAPTHEPVAFSRVKVH